MRSPLDKLSGSKPDTPPDGFSIDNRRAAKFTDNPPVITGTRPKKKQASVR